MKARHEIGIDEKCSIDCIHFYVFVLALLTHEEFESKVGGIRKIFNFFKKINDFILDDEKPPLKYYFLQPSADVNVDGCGVVGGSNVQ